MFPTLFTLGNFSAPTFPVVIVLALLLGAFLFWRACRHELIESNQAFDLIIIALIGALIGGRLLEFVVNWQIFNWSVEKLIFFNVWRGFDFYGAMLGGIFAILVYCQKLRLNPWQILDLAAAPAVFIQMIVALGAYAKNSNDNNFVYLIYAAFYFIIFWVLKRMAKRKRHEGFFICFYLTCISAVDLMLYKARSDVIYISGNISYQYVMSGGFLISTLIIWYRLAGRRIAEDAKSVFAFILLSLFRLKRILGDIEEAGKGAKSIVFAPLWICKSLYFSFKILAREVFVGLSDFLYVLGVKKNR